MTAATNVPHSRELRIDDLKVEDLFEVYWNDLYRVNLRYQRKLVWSYEEKTHFIDSMRRGYPVPLLLLARIQAAPSEHYEILDGLQRMNAIVSFIEGEVALDGLHFDLEAFAFCKSLKDPTTASWLTEFENLLYQSRTEQSLYDFKQGVFLLSETPARDPKIIPKIAETLCAMANLGPSVSGYVIIGVADNKKTATRIQKLFNIDTVEKNGYFIVGVDREASFENTDIDGYTTALTHQLRSQPIDKDLLPVIMAESQTLTYDSKTVVVFSVKSLDRPVLFNGKYYTRDMSNNRELEAPDMPALFARFR